MVSTWGTRVVESTITSALSGSCVVVSLTGAGGRLSLFGGILSVFGGMLSLRDVKVSSKNGAWLFFPALLSVKTGSPIKTG
jgi:hypothetical protein